jgi:Chloriridovirus flap endonuclease 1-A
MMNPLLSFKREKILKQSNISLDCPFDIGIVSSSIKDRHKYDVEISRSDYKILKILLKILNVTYIQAPGEAEAYCAYLMSKDLVDGVVSNDSDLLTYGCTKLILHINNDQCQYINLNILLEGLNFTKEQFVDFCIMCGTDYNVNIPSIGIQRSFRMISTYGSIDEIKHPQKDCLNHIRIREIFKTYGNVDDKVLVEVPYCGKVNIVLLAWFKIKFNLKFEPISLTKGFNISSVFN